MICEEIIFFIMVAGTPFFPQKGGKVQKGAKAPPFLWEKGAPANFKIPNLPTEFPFCIRYENTEKIPKGSYRNTESVYNSSDFVGAQICRYLSSCR
jgi:hypothetical protein